MSSSTVLIGWSTRTAISNRRDRSRYWRSIRRLTPAFFGLIGFLVGGDNHCLARNLVSEIYVKDVVAHSDDTVVSSPQPNAGLHAGQQAGSVASPTITAPTPDGDPVGHLISLQQSNDAGVSNIIQLLIACILGITLLVAIGAGFLFTVLRRYLIFWATSHLDEKFMEIVALSSDANARFISALEEFSTSQARTRTSELRATIEADVNIEPEWLLNAIAKVVLQPARLKDDVQAIAYRIEPESRQLHRIRTLWAEVKVESVDPTTARRMISSMIPLMEVKRDAATQVRALQSFLKQLDRAIAGIAALPDEPGF